MRSGTIIPVSIIVKKHFYSVCAIQAILKDLRVIICPDINLWSPSDVRTLLPQCHLVSKSLLICQW